MKLDTTASPAILRPTEAAKYLGISRRTLDSLHEKDPQFPRKIAITARCVGWRVSDLDTYVNNRIQHQGAA